MLMRAETQTPSFIHACNWFNPVTPSEGGGLQKFKQFLSSLLWECLDSDESPALARGSPCLVNLPGPRSLHMRGFLRNQLLSVTWGGMPDLLLFSLFFFPGLTVWHSGQQTSYVNVSEAAGMCWELRLNFDATPLDKRRADCRVDTSTLTGLQLSQNTAQLRHVSFEGWHLSDSSKLRVFSLQRVRAACCAWAVLLTRSCGGDEDWPH